MAKRNRDKLNYIAYDADGKLIFKTNMSYAKIFKTEDDEWVMEVRYPDVIYIARKLKDLDGRELINGYKLDLNNMSIEGKLSNYEKAGIKVQKENL